MPIIVSMYKKYVLWNVYLPMLLTVDDFELRQFMATCSFRWHTPALGRYMFHRTYFLSYNLSNAANALGR